MLELGCGYGATQLIALEPRLKRGIGVDFQIAPELHMLERFTFFQATIEEILPKLEVKRWTWSCSFRCWNTWLSRSSSSNLHGDYSDLQDCSVQCPDLGREAIPGVFCFPAWPQSESRNGRSQNVLRKRDLWPMLVRAGFKPSQIRLRYHKFGLNLFATAQKGDFGQHDHQTVTSFVHNRCCGVNIQA